MACGGGGGGGALERITNHPEPPPPSPLPTPLTQRIQSAAALTDRLSTCCNAEKRSPLDGGGGTRDPEDTISNDQDVEITSKRSRNVLR